MKIRETIHRSLLATMLCSSASGFEADNLVVLRVGDGSAPLSTAGNAAFLDEHRADGGLVSATALPTQRLGNQSALLLNGTSIPEGQLTRSQDGRFLLVSGYGRDLGTGSTILASTASADVPRTIARIDALGAIDTSTSLLDAYSTLGFRGVASADGSGFWLIGSGQGVRYANFGATSSALISDTATNLRHVKVIDNQVLIATAQGTAPFRVGSLGGLPQAGLQTISGLPGLPTDNAGLFANAFAALDLSPSEPGTDVLYVTEDLPNSTTSGLAKFSKVAGIWALNGRISLAPTRAVAVRPTNTGVQIFVIVTGETCSTWTSNVPTRLCALTDSGYNQSVSAAGLTEIAVPALNQAFRGLAFASIANAQIFGDGHED